MSQMYSIGERSGDISIDPNHVNTTFFLQLYDLQVTGKIIFQQYEFCGNRIQRNVIISLYKIYINVKFGFDPFLITQWITQLL